MAARKSVEIERWIHLVQNHVNWYALELVVSDLGFYQLPRVSWLPSQFDEADLDVPNLSPEIFRETSGYTL
jgi:hypothetical protein